MSINEWKWAEPLTVRALIAELQKCDPDKQVYIEDDGNEFGVNSVDPDYRVYDWEPKQVVFLGWDKRKG
jgi:hypothetical protein